MRNTALLATLCIAVLVTTTQPHQGFCAAAMPNKASVELKTQQARFDCVHYDLQGSQLQKQRPNEQAHDSAAPLRPPRMTELSPGKKIILGQTTQNDITFTKTHDLTATISDTREVTATPSLTATISDTREVTATPSLTATISDTREVTATPSLTATISDTREVTVTPSVSVVLTATRSDPLMVTPTLTLSGESTKTLALSHTVSKLVSQTVSHTGEVPSVSVSETVAVVSMTAEETLTSTVSLVPTEAETASVSLSLSGTPSIVVCPDAVPSSSALNVPATLASVRDGFRVMARVDGKIMTSLLVSGDDETVGGELQEGVNVSNVLVTCTDRDVGRVSRRGCRYFLSTLQRTVRLSRYDDGTFEVVWPPLPGYYISLPEFLNIGVPVEEALGCHVARASLQLRGEPPLSPQMNAEVAAEELPFYPLMAIAVDPMEQPAFVSVSGQVGTVVGMLSLLGAPFGVVGLNYVTVLSMMPCTPDATRRILSSFRSLSLTTIEDSFFGVLVGNLILGVAVLLVHTLVMVVAKLMRHLILSVAASRCWYPGFSLLVLVNLYVGTSFASMQGFSSNDGSTLALSVVMFVVFVCGTPVALVVCMIKVKSTFYPIRTVPAAPRRKDGRCLAVVANTWMVRVRGIWLPSAVTNRFVVLLMNLQRDRATWVTLWLWAPLVVAVIAAFPVISAAGCIAANAALTLGHLILFILVVVFRPLISPLDNGYYLTVMLVSMCILACNIALLLQPDNASALAAVCGAAIVAVLMFIVFVILKVVQLIVFCGKKWLDADVRSTPPRRHGVLNQSASLGASPDQQQQQQQQGEEEVEVELGETGEPLPLRVRPVMAPRVRTMVGRVVDVRPDERILPGQQLPQRLVDGLMTDNATAAGELAGPPVLPLQERPSSLLHRSQRGSWPSLDSISFVTLDAENADASRRDDTDEGSR
ncbi:hypothetical protein DQ04_06231010 [Trypanosoma grayi]|uniref:hypothetical protein n=1 Tax=Trypanosoma grayi TaxID=71804 RepID=UPI0004F40511|nr:hypothetical protein DQ04_06231010 [Trypanosoma grayi]KEG08896.1 hypothetical protein DQ04_06231010 [Trypanosoma grayi]